MTDISFSRPHDLELIPCTRCGTPHDPAELDRLLWCESCRLAARNEAGWWGWGIGVAFAAVVAAYVWGVIRPSTFVIGGWVATVVAAVWIGAKLGREIMYGVLRARARPGSDRPRRTPRGA